MKDLGISITGCYVHFDNQDITAVDSLRVVGYPSFQPD